MARLEREKNGGEVDLHRDVQCCEKNPGHLNFVPVDQFNVDHLPPGYRDKALVDAVRGFSHRIVHVSVKYVSDKRPEYFPGTGRKYACYNKRGKNFPMVGTGVVGGIVKFPTKKDADRSCDCKECLRSGNGTRQFAHIWIATATHVVFDEQEAAHTTCHLFFDKDRTPEKCEGVVKLSGFSMYNSNVERDTSILVYVTHDVELADKLWKELSFDFIPPPAAPTPSRPTLGFLRCDDGGITTSKHATTMCLANLLIQNLTEIMIQRLEDRLTQEQFDVRIKRLHDHMSGRLKGINAVDPKSIDVETLIGDLREIYEHFLKGKFSDKVQAMTDNVMRKLPRSLKPTLAAEIMINNLTEALTDKDMSSLTDTLTGALRDYFKHLRTDILKDRLTDITQTQRGPLTQRPTDIMKHRLTDSLKQRLTDTHILNDMAHKLIDYVTQSLLDGLIKELIENLIQGLTDVEIRSFIRDLTFGINDDLIKGLVERLKHGFNDRLTSTVTDVQNSSKSTMKGNQRWQRKLTPRIRQMDRMINKAPVIQVPVYKLAQTLIDNMNHVLINSLTQTDSPPATHANKMTERERLEMTGRFLTGLNIIVSHPHGCSKQVSVGFCTQKWDEPDKYEEYVYTTATCPGSSGAPVFVDVSDLCFINKLYDYPLHYGNFEDNKGLNFSYNLKPWKEEEKKP